VSPSGLTLLAPAKVNPVLEVLGKRPDGYHELALVFQAVSLFDELELREAGSGVELEILQSPRPLASDDSNLAVRAAGLFIGEALGGRGGVRLRLRKKIPLAAGLGGGSSDAAAVLAGMDLLFKTGLGRDRLAPWAARLGSDVPFFLWGGTAMGTGRGERIAPWEDGPELHLVLAKPSRGLSTPAVYQSGMALFTDGTKAPSFQKAWREGDPGRIAGHLYNGLQEAAFALAPETADLRRDMLDAGALGALVSGSGPTVFGLAENPDRASAIARRLEGGGREIMTARTLPRAAGPA
jgi:4-diphosphocytidyl-2-C-methyl-D-erythritol kinase